MAESETRGALALIAGGLLAIGALAPLTGSALAAEDDPAKPVVRRPAPHHRLVRTAAERRPLTIRPRPAPAPVDVVGTGFYGDDYLVRQHRWNDPRLYYFGPFRTGGEVFYGDQAGNPITRGNAGLGQVAGYGPARGGYGGPHFDAVGGFHQGPGPDAKIDADYASGDLNRPDYGTFVPHYESAKEEVEHLDRGPLASRAAPLRRPVVEAERSNPSFDQAKREFGAPMKRVAPVESGFANGGLPTIGAQIGNGEF